MHAFSKEADQTLSFSMSIPFVYKKKNSVGVLERLSFRFRSGLVLQASAGIV